MHFVAVKFSLTLLVCLRSLYLSTNTMKGGLEETKLWCKEQQVGKLQLCLETAPTQWWSNWVLKNIIQNSCVSNLDSRVKCKRTLTLLTKCKALFRHTAVWMTLNFTLKCFQNNHLFLYWSIQYICLILFLFPLLQLR